MGRAIEGRLHLCERLSSLSMQDLGTGEEMGKFAIREWVVKNGSKVEG